MNTNGVTRLSDAELRALEAARWQKLRSRNPALERVKCVVDFLAATLMLVVSGPVLLVAMAMIKLTSPGPIFYTQTRVGRNGRPFLIYKLRTMAQDAESLTGACWSVPGDQRVTRLGRWLRKTHIDELPQLWNVLCGDMSLIGPRPERPEFVPQLEQAIPHYRARLLVRPGVTGFAQVQLPADTDLESVRLKLAYDLYYLQTATAWMDLKVNLATALHMIGVPFDTIRKLFRFPAREKVEEAYRALGRPRNPRTPWPNRDYYGSATAAALGVS